MAPRDFIDKISKRVWIVFGCAATVACVLVCILAWNVNNILTNGEDKPEPQPANNNRLTDQEIQQLCGWGPPEATAEERIQFADSAFERVRAKFIPFLISNDEGQPATSEDKRVVLWDASTKVLGKHIPTGKQQIGDCFVAGTQVRTIDGDRSIEDIRVGDFIFDSNGELTVVVSTRAIQPKKRIVTVQAEGVEPFRCTADHKILTWKYGKIGLKWIEAGDLDESHFLVTPWSCVSKADQEIHRRRSKRVLGPGSAYLVHQVKSTPHCRDDLSDESVVYDIGVASESHSFLANGVAVHNCVSWGAKHASEYLLAVQIAMGNAQEWHPIYAPWIYGTSRVKVGGGRIGCNSDGSVGSWAATALMEYGNLPADTEGLDPYSGSIAKRWGCGRTFPFDKWSGESADHLVESAAKVTSWKDVRDAIVNGYPVTIASNRGFSTRGIVRDGKLWLNPSGSWAHQMCVIGYDIEPEPCFYILNSWGDFIGVTPPDGAPVGGFWVKANTIEQIVRQGDSFALSGQKGFPAQEIDWDWLIRRRNLRLKEEDHAVRIANDFALAI